MGIDWETLLDGADYDLQDAYDNHADHVWRQIENWENRSNNEDEE